MDCLSQGVPLIVNLINLFGALFTMIGTAIRQMTCPETTNYLKNNCYLRPQQHLPTGKHLSIIKSSWKLSSRQQVPRGTIPYNFPSSWLSHLKSILPSCKQAIILWISSSRPISICDRPMNHHWPTKAQRHMFTEFVIDPSLLRLSNTLAALKRNPDILSGRRQTTDVNPHYLHQGFPFLANDFPRKRTRHVQDDEEEEMSRHLPLHFRVSASTETFSKSIAGTQPSLNSADIDIINSTWQVHGKDNQGRPPGTGDEGKDKWASSSCVSFKFNSHLIALTYDKCDYHPCNMSPRLGLLCLHRLIGNNKPEVSR